MTKFEDTIKEMESQVNELENDLAAKAEQLDESNKEKAQALVDKTEDAIKTSIDKIKKIITEVQEDEKVDEFLDKVKAKSLEAVEFTKEKVAEKFGLFHRCVTILPTGLGNICNDVMGTVDEQSRAYLVTGGKLTSFAAAISGCIKMRSSVVVASLFQYASIIFGILVFSAIAFLSGFQKLGSLEVLVYITFWALATITTSLIKIK